MKSLELLVYAASFAVLTGLKLMSPDCGQSLGAEAWALFQGGSDYRLAVEGLGQSLFSGDAEELLREVFRPGHGGTENGSQGASVTVIDPTLYVGLPVAETECEAVQAFLRSQELYEGYAIPANVRTDMPELSLEHSRPVEGCGSSGFGFREHPLLGDVRFHYGTDFAAETGEPVLAFADGYVYAAGISESFGNYYIISHEGGLSTLYAHLSEFVALEGERVQRGQLIGRVGETGETTGPHLHFELRLGEKYLNPEYYL